MGNNYFTDPLAFLITTLFDLYILTVVLRFLLQWVHADFYNPISQFLVKATNPLLIPLRRILPGLGGIDIASLALILILTSIKFLLLFGLKGYVVPIIVLTSYVLVDVIKLFLYVFLFAIIIQVIISWVAPHQYNPFNILLHQLTDPLLKPIRRFIPALGGMDFSPLIAILLIQLSMYIIIPPIEMLAR